MNIRYKTYTLIQQESGFDLVETVQAQKIGTGDMKNPNGEFYDKEINWGYNMGLDACIRKLIHLELLKDKSTKELREFRDEFAKMYKELSNLL